MAHPPRQSLIRGSLTRAVCLVKSTNTVVIHPHKKSGENRGMRTTREQEFIREYNRAYGKAIGAERKKRKLSLEKLSSGIMSRTMLDKVEKGTAQWTKMEGDTLMLRMGILPEYFEALASGEDLERWRKREDISEGGISPCWKRILWRHWNSGS